MFLKLQIEAHSSNYWSLHHRSAAFLLFTGCQLSSAADTLISPFYLEILWFLLFHISWFSSNFCFWHRFLHIFAGTSVTPLASLETVNLCGLIIRAMSSLFISLSFLRLNSVFLVVCWNLSKMSHGHLLLSPPCLKKLDTFPLVLSLLESLPGFSIKSSFFQSHRLPNIFPFSPSIEMTTNQSSRLIDPFLSCNITSV